MNKEDVEYSVIRKNEIMSFAATRMNLEIIISEVSKAEKDKYHMVLLICGILTKKDRNEHIYKTETHRHRKQIYGYQKKREEE